MTSYEIQTGDVSGAKAAVHWSHMKKHKRCHQNGSHAHARFLASRIADHVQFHQVVFLSAESAMSVFSVGGSANRILEPIILTSKRRLAPLTYEVDVPIPYLDGLVHVESRCTDLRDGQTRQIHHYNLRKVGSRQLLNQAITKFSFSQKFYKFASGN